MAIHPFPQSKTPEHLTLVEPSADEADSPPSSGFVAYLEHASLDDLLQLENQSHSTGVFGVISGENQGYLHLQAGELIHAETDALEGEEALFLILSWNDGRFAQCPLPLSNRRTIDKSLELLLLMRTKRADESAQSTPSENKADLGRQQTGIHRTASSALRSDGIAQPEPQVRHRPRRTSTDVMLSPEGKIIEWQGQDAENFASQVAYATRLGALIGDAIGSGQPSQVELCGSKTRTVMFRLPEGTLAASRYARAAEG